MTTARKKAKYSRVYVKGVSWFWHVPGTNEWVKLCRVVEGEPAMLDRLAMEKKKRERPSGMGDVQPLIDKYVNLFKHTQKDPAWPKYGEYAAKALRDWDIVALKPTNVSDWLKKKYAGKLAMQRVMRAFLSGFFQWCVDTGKRDTNPCKEVKLKKSKARTTYITDDHFAAIRAAMLTKTYTKKDGKVITQIVPTGPMMQCFVDLCYLTAQRSTEIRLLKWSQIDRAAGVIHFLPTKTEDSSGIAVDFRISPEIDAVLSRIREIDKCTRIGELNVVHAVNGDEYAPSAFRSAWDRACERVELTAQNYNVKDIRAKALTDAERAGYDIKALQIAAAHSDTKTTEIYLKQRDVPVSDVRLRIPRSA